MTAKQQGKAGAPAHTALLENRRHLTIEGVSEVVSFDETVVTLNTTLGAMNVEGEGLHILSLSLETGRVTLEGNIDTLRYEDRTEKTRRGFFGRLVH